MAHSGSQPEAMAEYEEGRSAVKAVCTECWICSARIDEEKDVENLVSPCICTGSMEFAHRLCVQKLCYSKQNSNCPNCRETFRHPDGREFDVQPPVEAEPLPQNPPIPNPAQANANPNCLTIGRMLRRLACCAAAAPVQDEPAAQNPPIPDPAQANTN